MYKQCIDLKDYYDFPIDVHYANINILTHTHRPNVELLLLQIAIQFQNIIPVGRSVGYSCNVRLQHRMKSMLLSINCTSPSEQLRQQSIELGPSWRLYFLTCIGRVQLDRLLRQYNYSSALTGSITTLATISISIVMHQQDYPKIGLNICER